MADKSSVNDLPPCPRSTHNVEILKMMMKEFGINECTDTAISPCIQHQRLLAFEALITVLLQSKRDLMHAKVMTKIQVELKRFIVCKNCAVQKIFQLYPFLKPILMYDTRTKMVVLHKQVRGALTADKSGFWTFKNSRKDADFAEELAEKKSKGNDTSLQSDKRDQCELKDDVTFKRESVSPPPSKVARIEPLRRPDSAEMDEKSERGSDDDSPRRRMSERLLANKIREERLKNMKHKSTMTRVIDDQSGKKDKWTNTFVVGSKNYRRQQGMESRPNVPYTKIFHCKICERVPRHHVVMDARCGSLIGCLPCMKERKKTLTNCSQCGHRGRYIVLKYLHEKLLKMS